MKLGRSYEDALCGDLFFTILLSFVPHVMLENIFNDLKMIFMFCYNHW